ncbi:MAG: chemotaxis protein CheW [Lachnospiraceae bacterium]|jgi:purine-binding chemotaxis protein CheW|nr:chemotaxis protein CheW [Lachnospiraceae bacterium]
MDEVKTATSAETGISTSTSDVAGAIQYIVIRLGNELYGIDINYIDNIVRVPNMTRVPKVQPYILGVINLRGEVVPVMSIRLRMGLEATEVTKATRIIILKTEQYGTIGVIVDEVKEVVTLSPDMIEKATYSNANGNFISGIGKYNVGNGYLISLLDLNALFSD